MTVSKNNVALAYMGASVFADTLIGALAKSLSRTYPLMEIIFIRYVLVVVLLLFLVPRFGGFAVLRVVNWRSHLTRSVYGVLATLSYLYSIRELPFAEATTVSFTAPLFTACLTLPVLGERVRPVTWGALILGLAGVCISLRPTSMSISSGYAAGILGAMFLALMRLELRRLVQTDTGVTITFYYAAFSLIVSGVLSSVDFRAPTGPDLTLMLAVGVLTIVSTLVAAYAHVWEQAHRLSFLEYTSLLWAAVFGAVVWGEVPHLSTIYGASVIIAGGVWLTLQDKSWPPMSAVVCGRRNL